jgi:cytosine deaminase
MKQVRLYNLRLPDAPEKRSELLFEDGVFVEHFSAAKPHVQSIDAGGAMALPGLVETHIHLDKACIMHRCQLDHGTLSEAIEQTRRAKAEFTQDDVYKRGAKVIEKAVVQGTSYMRTHVEIDPIIGLTGFRAIQKLKVDYSWAIDLQICVFPQEGLLNNQGTEALLCEALEAGADLLGGCPYTDSDPIGQIRKLFELARYYDCDLDLHLDFDLNPEEMTISEVIRQTVLHGWEGRVTIGHVTKLSALPPKVLQEIASQLAQADVRVTSLPSTDLFLMGREASHNIPRGVAPLKKLSAAGVTCSVSTNNIGNPFTPFGDASLVRQSNLFANINHMGTTSDLLQCLGWISTESARLIGLERYGLTPGCQANFVLFPVTAAEEVIAEIVPPTMGFRKGNVTFTRERPILLGPENR